MQSEPKILEKLKTSSLLVLSNEVDDPNIGFSEAEFSDLPFHEGMTLTVLHSDDYQILLKLHFNNLSVLGFFEKHFKKSTITNRIEVIDYMKEMCNIVAGKYKQLVFGFQEEICHCVPVYIAGYTELMFTTASESKHYFWNIKNSKNNNIYFSATLDILNKKTFNNLFDSENHRNDDAFPIEEW